MADEILPCGKKRGFGITPDCIVSDVCKTCASIHTKTDAPKRKIVQNLFFEREALRKPWKKTAGER